MQAHKLRFLSSSALSPVLHGLTQGCPIGECLHQDLSSVDVLCNKCEGRTGEDE